VIAWHLVLYTSGLMYVNQHYVYGI